ncbi:MAG: cupredoxin domain-containing protein [Magnetospirillum sp.]|nr:cupredoxin domain-containing protein [Magnetospirillum sp.]
MRFLAILAAIVLLGASPAMADPARPDDPNETWLPANFSWDRPTETVVTLLDNSFEPSALVFDRNKPYRLVLKNVGHTPHDLVDLNFFHAIVLRAVVSSNGTVFTPHIHSLSVQPGSVVTITFAAVKPGSFDIFCSIPGHREDGMEGKVVLR